MEIVKIFDYLLTNKDGHDCSANEKAMAIEIDNNRIIYFKECITREQALEIMNNISHIEKK